jgi:predicted porin
MAPRQDFDDCGEAVVSGGWDGRRNFASEPEHLEMGMKNKFMAAAAVVAILTATGAHAQTADIATLKAQSAALKKQNAALEARLNKLEKEQVAQSKAQPAATSFMAADLSGIKGPLPIPQCALPSLDGPLTFCGITVFGTIDAGLGYASSGLPSNGKFYLGDEVVNKNARAAYFGINPNGLSTSTLGVKGSVEVLPGWSGVFMASTNINPQSGQLANAPGSLIDQNGLNRNNFSMNGDGSRGGQAFNDQLYVGVASKEFGQLTFGRHRSLLTDLAGAYDASASNAYSLINYSGTYVAGLGNTANSRMDDSFKYRVEYGPVRFGALYKFADGNGGSNVGTNGTFATNTVPGVSPHNYSTQNDAAQFNLGGSYGGLDVDGVLGYFHQAVANGILSPAQLGGASTFTSNQFTATHGNQVTTSTGNANANTLAGTITDNTGGAIAAKYTWNQFKLFAGWSHVIFHNPENNVGIGAQGDQGGYIISSANNGSLPHAKLLDTIWGGVKYSYDPKTDFSVSYYHGMQNSYGWAANTLGVSNTASTSLATCGLPVYVSNVNGATINGVKYAYQAAPRSSTCSGTIDAVSAYVDYHFNKRFDVYGGIMYSVVGGGLASGYYNVNNFAPTVGARFTF